MTEEEIKKGAAFLDELSTRLRLRQIHCSRDEQFLTATMDGYPVARVAANEDLYQRKTDLNTPAARELYFEVLENAHEVSEYLKQMDRSPELDAEGLSDSFKLLAEYRDTVFCGCQYGNGLGAKLITSFLNVRRETPHNTTRRSCKAGRISPTLQLLFVRHQSRGGCFVT